MNDPNENEGEDQRLSEFARRFEASRPSLPEQSLKRIERAVHSEIRRVDRRRNLAMAVSAAGLAAAVLLAIGFLVTSFSGRPAPVATVPPDEAPVVEDQYSIALTPPGEPATAADPLLRLDDYRTLIEDGS